jgi:hypothetical protein
MSYPAKYKMSVRKGDTLDKTFTWSVEDVPVNLTGCLADMQVRSSPESTRVILEAGNFITLGGTLGTVRLNIPAGTIGAIEPGRYVYDLEIDNGGTVTTLLAGVFQVQPEVTR